MSNATVSTPDAAANNLTHVPDWQGAAQPRYDGSVAELLSYAFGGCVDDFSTIADMILDVAERRAKDICGKRYDDPHDQTMDGDDIRRMISVARVLIARAEKGAEHA